MQADGTRTVIGKLGDPFDGGFQFVLGQVHGKGVLLGQYALIIGEVPGELAGEQEAIAELEEEVIVITGKSDLGIGSSVTGELEDLSHRLLGQ